MILIIILCVIVVLMFIISCLSNDPDGVAVTGLFAFASSVIILTWFGVENPALVTFVTMLVLFFIPSFKK